MNIFVNMNDISPQSLLYAGCAVVAMAFVLLLANRKRARA